MLGNWEPRQRTARGATEERGTDLRPRKFIAKPSQKSGGFTNSSGKDGASEGIRNLIGFRSHLANLLGTSAFCDFCLTPISHQSERKRIGTGSNCAKIKTCSSIAEYSEARAGIDQRCLSPIHAYQTNSAECNENLCNSGLR